VNLYIGTGSDWKNLPGIAQFLSTQTDTTFALIHPYFALMTMEVGWVREKALSKNLSKN
jgi:hypothetical protein